MEKGDKKGNLNARFYREFLPVFIAALLIFSVFLLSMPKLINLSETITGMASFAYYIESNYSIGTYTNTTSNSSNVVYLNQTEYHDNYNDENLVLWLHFNESSGTPAEDMSQYSNDGTLNNMGTGALNNGTSGWNSSGMFGTNSMSFDGVNDFVQVDNTAFFNYPTKGTSSLWVYPRQNGTVPDNDYEFTGFWGKGDVYIVFGYLSNNLVRAYAYTGSLTYLDSITPLINNTWNHVAITWNASGSSIYVNGEYDVSGTFTYSNVHAGHADVPFYVGRNPVAWVTETKYYFNGMIDEAAIWNRSLSDEEVANLYRRTKGTYASDIHDLGEIRLLNYLNFTLLENSTGLHDNTTFQVRSCDDSACSGESFVGPGSDANSYFNSSGCTGISASESSCDISSLSANRYFQWKAFFQRNTTNGTGNPQIVNVSLGHGSATPTVTLNSPIDNFYNSSSTINLNCSATTGTIGNITFYINSTGTFTTNKTNGTTNLGSDGSVNFTIENIADGSYIWNCLANNTGGLSAYASANRTFTIDTIKPYINFTDPTKANKSFWSHTSINVTVSATEANEANITFALYNNSCNDLVNSTNYTFASFGAKRNVNFTHLDKGGLGEGNYCYNVTIYDKAGNSNMTGNRTITLDRTIPHIQNITNVSTDFNASDIDPLKNFTIVINITDRSAGIDTAILQYNKSRDVDGVWIGWEEARMQNITGRSIGDYWNASMNVSTNGTWYYRIWVNDTAGNTNTSWNESFDSQYDCTWHSNDTISGTSIGTISQTKEIGNITIFNDGDYDYWESHCSLAFSISSTGISSTRVKFNDSTTRNYLSKTIGAKESYTANASITFDSTPNTEYLVISATESASITSISANTSNTTATTYVGGPYLEVTINKTQETMNQTSSLNYVFEAYVKNIGNSSAYNVTLNWTLPTGWTNSSGLLTNSMNEVNCSDPTISLSSGCTTDTAYHLLYSKLTANINDPEDAASIGTVTIWANSSSNETSINDSSSTTVSVVCHGISDTICGAGCVYDSTKTNYDPDCPAPSTTTVTTTTGGGGTGMSGAASVKSEATYELVRGKDNSFNLEIKNPFNDANLSNIKVSASGFLAQYISIEPEQLSVILPKSSYNFTIKITAPSYFDIGSHDLTFTIYSYKQIGPTTELREEKKYITLAIHELSRADAESMTSDAQATIIELKSLNLNTKEIEDLLNKINEALDSGDLDKVSELSSQIETIKESALYTSDVIKEYEQKIISARNQGIKTPKTERLIELAKSAMERGEYTLALERAKDAEMTYAIETKGEFNIIYYVTQNTLEAFIITLISLSLLLVLFFRAKLTLINHELKDLYEEEDILSGLMKTVQNECFAEKKMSMAEYYQTMSQYEDELSKNIQRTIMYESAKTNLFKFKRQRLELERNRILEMMKETQKEYMQENKIDTRVYTNKMHSFSTRLSEVEEEIALHEAESAIKKDRTRRFLKFLGFIKAFKIKPEKKTAEQIKKLELKKESEIKKKMARHFIELADKEQEKMNKLSRHFIKEAEKEEK